MPMTKRSANGKLVVRAADGSSNQAGVYCWMNLLNGKLYVGSAARGLKKRYGNYVGQTGHDSLLSGKCHNRHLQRAWDKYGKDAFVFVPLETCPKDQCVAREQFWMYWYESANPTTGYNICPTAGSSLGVKHSDETKAKVTEALKKRGPESAETKAKRSASLMGHPVSKETREKVAAARRGKPLSEEHKAKLSIAGRWQTRVFTEEHKTKLSIAARARQAKIRRARWERQQAIIAARQQEAA